jgi:[ribosomal protein S18]-alanine N-acetyltransferase
MTSREPVVRPANRGDLDAVLENEVASFSTPWSRRTFEALLDRPTVAFRVLVLEGRVVGHGLLWWSGSEAEVANVAIHPRVRGEGLGGTLLDALLAEAGVRGVDKVFLEVREANSWARALYARRGFVSVGRRPGYYRKPTEDAVVMALELDAGQPLPVSDSPPIPPETPAR